MGIKIKNLPKFERPREKAIRYGIDILSNVELLAIVIGSGTKDNSAIDISYNLLSNFAGVKNLVSSTFEELKEVKGISTATALKLSAMFEFFNRFNSCLEEENELITPEIIYRKYAKTMNNSMQENVGLIVMNGSKKVIREKIIYKGTNSEVSISYFELIKEVLLVKGKHIYVFHNHPSGNSMPSNKDIFFTRGLIEELTRIGIKLIDHVVLGDGNYYSFKNGLIYELTP